MSTSNTPPLAPSPSTTPTPQTPTSTTGIPDLPPSSPTLPLTMTSSLLLTNLPRDSSSALEHAFSFPTAKITVRFQPIGSAPLLQRPVSKISSSQRFETVVAYLRRVLKLDRKGGEGPGESVFLYVNSCFAPSLDEVVGNLHRCFKDSKDQLIVTYSMTPAFG
ncbi:Ubiquitin-like protein [Ciborinia camelliae]|nr:Ubiquitin-like protein [Ciborinia camelliae]